MGRVPSMLPTGEPAPADGALPRPARSPFAFYVHVPFCTVRCGYCDFNTYTASELGGGAFGSGTADSSSWV